MLAALRARALPWRDGRQVWDNDGEFLLVEAAYQLPRWLSPETAPNRVWLHRGAVHIVPPPSPQRPGLPPKPTLRQGLRAVFASCRAHEGGGGGGGATAAPLGRPPAVQTLAPKVTRAIERRLEGFPKRWVVRALVGSPCHLFY